MEMRDKRIEAASEQEQASRAQMIGLDMLELVSKLLLEAHVQGAQGAWQLEELPKGQGLFAPMAQTTSGVRKPKMNE